MAKPALKIVTGPGGMHVGNGQYSPPVERAQTEKPDPARDAELAKQAPAARKRLSVLERQVADTDDAERSAVEADKAAWPSDRNLKLAALCAADDAVKARVALEADRLECAEVLGAEDRMNQRAELRQLRLELEIGRIVDPHVAHVVDHYAALRTAISDSGHELASTLKERNAKLARANNLERTVGDGRTHQRYGVDDAIKRIRDAVHPAELLIFDHGETSTLKATLSIPTAIGRAER